MWEKIKTFVWYERGAFIGLFAGGLWLLAMLSLQSCVKTDSILEPGKRITPVQLEQEVATIQNDYKEAVAESQTAIERAKVDYDKLVVELKATTEKAAVDLATQTDKAVIAAADLQEQAERLDKLIQIGGGMVQLASTGGLTSQGAINTLLTGVGLFSIADSLRKRKKIQELLPVVPPTV